MKIDEAGMNGLILGLPLGGVLAHAGTSATVVEPQAAGAPLRSEQANHTPGQARPVLWPRPVLLLTLGACVGTMAWMIFQGAMVPTPTPEQTILMPQVQPQKIERVEVPTLEPLPPLTNSLVEPQVIEPASADPSVAEDQVTPKQATAANPVQKKAVAIVPQHIKVHPVAAPIGSPQTSMPAPALPAKKEARPSAVTLAPEKIDGAAIGIISAANDKLIMSVDGSFRVFRPGERLPFNEVLVSVRNGTITTDRRVFELAQP
jgi:hypothetical protein